MGVGGGGTEDAGGISVSVRAWAQRYRGAGSPSTRAPGH